MHEYSAIACLDVPKNDVWRPQQYTGCTKQWWIIKYKTMKQCYMWPHVQHVTVVDVLQYIPCKQHNATYRWIFRVIWQRAIYFKHILRHWSNVEGTTMYYLSFGLFQSIKKTIIIGNQKVSTDLLFPIIKLNKILIILTYPRLGNGSATDPWSRSCGSICLRYSNSSVTYPFRS